MLKVSKGAKEAVTWFYLDYFNLFQFYFLGSKISIVNVIKLEKHKR